MEAVTPSSHFIRSRSALGADTLRTGGVFALSLICGALGAFVAFDAFDRPATGIDDADIFIQNFRPGVFDRMGLGYDDLAKTNPLLIYARTSGYGMHGDEVTRPALDPVGQARSGMYFAPILKMYVWRSEAWILCEESGCIIGS